MAAAYFRKAGGLLSLRMMAENASGTMRVEADPGFRLTIRLPAENAGE